MFFEEADDFFEAKVEFSAAGESAGGHAAVGGHDVDGADVEPKYLGHLLSVENRLVVLAKVGVRIHCHAAQPTKNRGYQLSCAMNLAQPFQLPAAAPTTEMSWRSARPCSDRPSAVIARMFDRAAKLRFNRSGEER